METGCSCHMVAPREARDIADSCSVHVVDSAGDWEDHLWRYVLLW